MGLDDYVEMHNILFEKQNDWSFQSNAADLFVDYAAEIGLERESMMTCLENHDFESQVEADVQEAMQLGFNGTPTFLINGQPLVGEQPYELFVQAVETLIAEETVQTGGN